MQNTDVTRDLEFALAAHISQNAGNAGSPEDLVRVVVKTLAFHGITIPKVQGS